VGARARKTTNGDSAKYHRPNDGNVLELPVAKGGIKEEGEKGELYNRKA
jgi:hypothetical protein